MGKVRPFVLYSLRHTFLTRLGESGCDAWTLARIAGHTNVSMSSPMCIHPRMPCSRQWRGWVGTKSGTLTNVLFRVRLAILS